MGELAEKELGLKSSGDGERMMSFVERVGARGDFALSGLLAGGPIEADKGETEAPRLSGSPLEEAGETLASGLAMRRPPRDSARLRSASIVPGDPVDFMALGASFGHYQIRGGLRACHINVCLKRYMVQERRQVEADK